MVAEQAHRHGDRRELWYILLAALVAAISLAGYVGYVLYPRFDLPAEAGIGLLVLAAGAGVASFFSPCSFPLLVTLLARDSEARAGDRSSSGLHRVLASASALALGATAFLVLVGVGVALGASALFEGVTFTSTTGRVIRLVVGVLLILLGLMQSGLIRTSFGVSHLVSTPVMRRQARWRREYPTLRFGIFGFIYIFAGFG